MTLDICKLLYNVVNKQMKIHHTERCVGVYHVEDIPADVKDKISEKFGEDYLGDANIIMFFKGEETKESIEKLFKTVDNALGNDANLLVVGDFKKLSVKSSSEKPEEEKPAKDDSKDDSEDDSKDDAKEEKTSSEDKQSDEKEIQDDIEEVLNEDDSDDEDDSGDEDDSDESNDEPEEDTDEDTEKSEEEKPEGGESD